VLWSVVYKMKDGNKSYEADLFSPMAAVAVHNKSRQHESRGTRKQRQRQRQCKRSMCGRECLKLL